MVGRESTLANLGNDHEFISKEYIFIGMRSFGEAQNKAMRLMLEVDNIIPLWRVVIPNMASESCPNLVMSIESSNVGQRSWDLRKCSQKVSNIGCTLFEGSREKSRTSIKGRLFEGSIGLWGGSIVYFVRGEDC